MRKNDRPKAICPSCGGRKFTEEETKNWPKYMKGKCLTCKGIGKVDWVVWWWLFDDAWKSSVLRFIHLVELNAPSVVIKNEINISRKKLSKMKKNYPDVFAAEYASVKRKDLHKIKETKC